MKFLMNETSTVAVNTAFVVNFYIQKNYTSPSVCVVAQCSADFYDPDKAAYSHEKFTLKTFDSDDKDKNLTAAKKYLVELVDKLNSGGNL